MSKTPILITGCQRSGTTLLRLVLNSHPDIMSFDEGDFDYASLNTYLHAQWFPDFVSFKLPRYAPMLSFIKSIKSFRIIWCIRDPVDVVWSMMKLKIPFDETNAVSWAAHPACAQREILNSYWSFGETEKLGMEYYMNQLSSILKKPPMDRSRHEKIFMGALCWSIKNQLPFLYKEENIEYLTVNYETLVTSPKETIKKILEHSGAVWSDNVLRHHELHDGISIGNTSNSRPIDSTGVGSGVKKFSQEEVNIIKNICSKTADLWGYNFTG